MDSLQNNQPLTASIDQLRLPQNYGQTFGSRKLLVNVPVMKPPKEKFFRTHRSLEMVFDGYVIEDKKTGGYHLVSPVVAAVLGKLARPARLHTAIDRGDNPFLIPIPLPDASGQRNPWHESLSRAVELAKDRWIRVVADKRSGNYEVFEALGELPEPNWPEIAMDDLITKAFSGRTITDEHHPIVQEILGRI
jgi:hypothetical protein